MKRPEEFVDELLIAGLDLVQRDCEKLKTAIAIRDREIWCLADRNNEMLLAVAAEVNAVGNADKDPAAAIEAIGKILGEPF